MAYGQKRQMANKGMCPYSYLQYLMVVVPLVHNRHQAVGSRQ